MNDLYTVSGTYGCHKTPCEIFVYCDSNSVNWYVIEDSLNVNATYENLEDGVNVELLADIDCVTATEKINSENELITLIRGY